eukprot:3023768-Rhodomonas_salina.1
MGFTGPPKRRKARQGYTAGVASLPTACQVWRVPEHTPASLHAHPSGPTLISSAPAVESVTLFEAVALALQVCSLAQAVRVVALARFADRQLEGTQGQFCVTLPESLPITDIHLLATLQ